MNENKYTDENYCSDRDCQIRREILDTNLDIETTESEINYLQKMMLKNIELSNSYYIRMSICYISILTITSLFLLFLYKEIPLFKNVSIFLFITSIVFYIGSIILTTKSKKNIDFSIKLQNNRLNDLNKTIDSYYNRKNILKNRL